MTIKYKQSELEISYITTIPCSIYNELLPGEENCCSHMDVDYFKPRRTGGICILPKFNNVFELIREHLVVKNKKGGIALFLKIIYKDKYKRNAPRVVKHKCNNNTCLNPYHIKR